MTNTGLPAILLSLARDKRLRFYSAVTLLGAPLFLVRKWRTMRRFNIDCEFDPARWTLRFPARLGAQPQTVSTPTGPRVMFFATGWGEMETLKPLIRALRVARPDVRVLITTKHSETIAAAVQISDETVSPLPFDNAISVARWLQKTRPDVVIFYERIDYGILLRSLWNQRVPFVVLHARTHWKTPKSKSSLAFKQWQLRGLRALLLATPENEAGALQQVPASAKIHIVGSIKFPYETPVLLAERATDLRAWIERGAGDAPLLAAGSTHETEEEFVLDALEIVRRDTQGVAPALLLAPRKPGRADEICALLKARGFTYSRRSQGPSATPVDVLVLDTLGELKVAYQFVQAAFVGGTLCGISHNVAEPLIWSIPVSFGPDEDNFKLEHRLCLQAGVGYRVHTPQELAAHWTQVLNSPALRAQMSQQSAELIQSQRRSFENILRVLIETIDDVD